MLSFHWLSLLVIFSLALNGSAAPTPGVSLNHYSGADMDANMSSSRPKIMPSYQYLTFVSIQVNFKLDHIFTFGALAALDVKVGPIIGEYDLGKYHDFSVNEYKGKHDPNLVMRVFKVKEEKLFDEQRRTFRQEKLYVASGTYPPFKTGPKTPSSAKEELKSSHGLPQLPHLNVVVGGEIRKIGEYQEYSVEEYSMGEYKGKKNPKDLVLKVFPHEDETFHKEIDSATRARQFIASGLVASLGRPGVLVTLNHDHKTI
ncbi:hypothetical protein BDP27DRAFT_1407009 [Rhodocollybia butyracea]|uniref:Uncharacterized protein n=1 Tax=Rhodocollybia butyracea TaxID=206335 RepID=A0A9P5P851_9AGAR|nr:hypothetical protein BDP27DRAFT_1407009 [Rhodocollybia butyracea]